MAGTHCSGALSARVRVPIPLRSFADTDDRLFRASAETLETPAQCRTRPLANQSRRNLPYFLRKAAVIGWKPLLRKMRSHSAAGNEPSFCGISTNGSPESVFPKETDMLFRVDFEIVDGILKDLSTTGIEKPLLCKRSPFDS